MKVRAAGTHFMRGKVYRVQGKRKIGLTGQIRGQCSRPGMKRQVIFIEDGQAGGDILDTLIHEALHACVWDLSEEAIVETANSLSRLLVQAGVRFSGKGFVKL